MTLNDMSECSFHLKPVFFLDEIKLFVFKKSSVAISLVLSNVSKLSNNNLSKLGIDIYFIEQTSN